MAERRHVRVAVTGAAGQIGYALLFRIASGQMFGPETDVTLQLLELPQALPSLKGVAMELDDCAFPLLRHVTCTADVNEAMKEVNWAVLVGAVPRKEGMERSDLLRINGGVFSEQGRAINEQAASDVRVFVVGNPCNTNCLIALKNAPDVPPDRFYAMTMLDELRARKQLALKAGVPVTAVTRMTIWGNHSSTQYPDFYNARLNGKPVTKTLDVAWLQEAFISLVQKRGAEVIRVRGASSAASAANAALQGVYHLVHDTADDETFSVGKVSDGEYGVDAGLVFSFPCRTEKGKLKVVTGLTHDTFGMEKIRLTLTELREERRAVEALQLI